MDLTFRLVNLKKQYFRFRKIIKHLKNCTLDGIVTNQVALCFYGTQDETDRADDNGSDFLFSLITNNKIKDPLSSALSVSSVCLRKHKAI